MGTQPGTSLCLREYLSGDIPKKEHTWAPWHTTEKLIWPSSRAFAHLAPHSYLLLSTASCSSISSALQVALESLSGFTPGPLLPL